MVDGTSILRELRNILNETSTSSFLDTRSSYYYLWLAATELVDRTECLTTTQTITTVASQQAYDLNPDFLRLYMKDTNNNLFIRYNDGTTTSTLKFKKYESVYYDNDTSTVSVPDSFATRDDPTKETAEVGTATSVGAASAGQCTLTDTAADFTNVAPGDIVNNTTDGASGYVLSKTSTTVIATALFDGTGNDWTQSDAYTIQPQGRLQLVIVPTPSTSGHTITVPYVQRPDPVFSNYGIYRFNAQYLMALCFYAAWLYKYRDSDSNFGDKFYQYFDSHVRKANVSSGRGLNKRGINVSFKARN